MPAIATKSASADDQHSDTRRLYPVSAPQQIASPSGLVPTVRVAESPRLWPITDATDIVFSQLATSNALSQTRVGQIVQDDQGFLWFGTQYGLNRYDGYQYKVFTHDPQRPGSLSGAYIHALFKDRSGVLWVGNDEALDQFDPTTENFKHYTIGRDRDGAPISVTHISQDTRGTLWLATGYGLYGMDPVSGRLVHFMHSPADPLSLASNNIKFTGLDSTGRFWVVNDEGLDQFDRETGKVILHVPLPEPRAMAFCEDKHGNFWITHASGSGLALLDRDRRMLVPIVFVDQKDSSNPTVAVYAALEDREGSMWFATGGQGLLRFDQDQNRMLRYRHRPGDSQSLVADNVIALFQDRENDIWVGLHAVAPNYFALQRSGFEKLPYGPMPTQSRGMVDMVNSIYEARDSTLWISYMGTLTAVDRTTDHTVSYREKERGGGGDVLTMTEDPSGNFWMGTWGRGLARFDKRRGRFTWFTHSAANPSSLSNDIVTRLLVDHVGRLWAATWNGLDLVNSSTGSFVAYRPSAEPQSQTYLGIAEDAQGILWLATYYSGLQSFDPATGRFKIYEHSSTREGTLSNNRVNSVHVDHQGKVWAGTQDGLSRLDPSTGLFSTWTERDGLPGNVVSCILEDAAGTLWVSTNRGIAQFDPQRHQFRSFSVADGLPGNDLTGWSACFRSSSGEMFFGGFSGATAFHPERITDRVFVPHVVLTGFEVAGVPAKIGGDSPLLKSIGFTREVTLAPDQNNFSVEFSALGFGSPRTIRYRYRLEGLDEPWHEVHADRRIATYTTLPGGSYTLRIQGATARGPWSEPGVSLSVTILPHWWSTWWFRGVCALLLMLAVIVSYRIHMRQITQRVSIRMQERMDERARIARELHDTLLQGFQGLVLLFGAVTQRIPVEHPTRELLGKALKSADRVLAEGRDRVRGLRDSITLNHDLPTALKEAAEDLSLAHPVEFSMSVTGTRRPLHTVVMRRGLPDCA